MDEGWKLLDYRNLTGILSRSDGLLERAEAALRRIVGAHPNDAAALLRLGDVLRSQGRLDDALWTPVEGVVASLCEEFEVDAATCLKDLAVLLDDLSSVGLAEVAP